MTKPIRLEDLQPEPAEFYLRKTEKTYRLRMVTLADDRWMLQTFGDELKSILERGRMEEICRIIFHLLEDKSDFRMQDVTELDENGEERSVRVGGVELLKTCISGIPEKIVIYRALMHAIGISGPLMDSLVKEEAEKKSREQEASAGEPSSTSSPPSTDGPGSISGA